MSLAFYKIFGNDDLVELHPVSYGLIDGYVIGDTLLENVMFKYSIFKHSDDDPGHLIVEFHEPNTTYLKRLNMDYWLDEALKYVLDNSSGVEFELEDRNTEVILYDHDKVWSDQPYTYFDEEPTFHK